jgi:hypothetical protein
MTVGEKSSSSQGEEKKEMVEGEGWKSNQYITHEKF